MRGQQATVLLPAQPKTPAEAKAQTRVVYVGWHSWDHMTTQEPTGGAGGS
jgi:hypothetical protein